MGRRYDGDIKGKFWFAVQSSDDALFFGGQESEPNYIDYYFHSDDLESVDNGLEKCLEVMGDYKKELDDFFKKNNLYNNDKIIKETSFEDEKKVKDILRWYARYELGKKIKKCIKKQGDCHFEAEI